MTHSINYYIQLPEELANKIDSLPKDELADVAYRVLNIRKHRMDKGIKTLVLDKSSTNFEVTLEQALVLAHGLLAKAV